MKIKSKFFALFMALCMCICCFTTTAFAQESTHPLPELTEESIYDIPDDAVIIYQGDDGIVYQSKEKASTFSARGGNLTYNDAYLTKNTFSSFSVENPNSGNTCYGTLRVESDSNSSYAAIYFYYGSNFHYGKIYKSNGDLYFSFKASAANCTVQYSAYPENSSWMRICCWLYEDQPQNYNNLPKFPGNVAP